MKIVALTVTVLMGLVPIHAHPGHHAKNGVEGRSELSEYTKRDISHCSAQLKARGLQKRTVERRMEVLRSERERRGLSTEFNVIKARELDTRTTPEVLATNHTSSVVYGPSTSLDTLFAGNQSCILVPESIEGPFYVSGEFIRSDVREASHQIGIDLILDIEVIDSSTCLPVPNVMVEIWHANATGVYSGVVSVGNGDSTVGSNINSTFGRGLQKTDAHGAVKFTTFYPGHYVGRTQHIHVGSHYNGTLLPNNTFVGSTMSHIGQIFFDTSLSTSVQGFPPYSSVNSSITTNAEDWIFVQEAAIGDPVAEYSLLGSSLSDGLFAWIAFGIDLTHQATITAAASYGANGGHAN